MDKLTENPAAMAIAAVIHNKHQRPRASATDLGEPSMARKIEDIAIKNGFRYDARTSEKSNAITYSHPEKKGVSVETGNSVLGWFDYWKVVKNGKTFRGRNLNDLDSLLSESIVSFSDFVENL